MKNSIRLTASAELLIAAAFWGFGFIGTVWALKLLSPLHVIFLRFFLAGLIGLAFLFSKKRRQAITQNLALSFWPALLLVGTLLFQTWGLLFTTATKSGFITTLYVVIVPVFESAFRRRNLPLSLWLCVGAALIGTGMIVDIGFAEFNKGDLLTLICAFLAAAQIYLIGILSPRVRAPFVFNIMQAWWAVLICLPLLYFDPLRSEMLSVEFWPTLPLIGLLTLAFGSTVIAFYLQVRAQAHLSATVSSLFFLLESPYALLFAMLLLGETLGWLEAWGAALIFFSAVAANLIDARRKPQRAV